MVMMRKGEEHETKRVLGMNVNANRRQPKKRYMDCMKNVMTEKGLDEMMTNDREEEKNIVRRLQLFWEQGKKMMSKFRTRDLWLTATNLDANGKEISRT